MDQFVVVRRAFALRSLIEITVKFFWAVFSIRNLKITTERLTGMCVSINNILPGDWYFFSARSTVGTWHSLLRTKSSSKE